MKTLSETPRSAHWSKHTAIISCVLALFFHLGAGWLDERKVVFSPHGHLIFVVAAAWLIAFAASATLLLRDWRHPTVALSGLLLSAVTFHALFFW
jgi:hypothetical protein